MKPVIERLPAVGADLYMRGETLRIAKFGGMLGVKPRYYLLSKVRLDTLAEEEQQFVDMVDGLKQNLGEFDFECLAFPIDSPDQPEPAMYVEVAGHSRNGASIECIVQEVLENDDL